MSLRTLKPAALNRERLGRPLRRAVYVDGRLGRARRALPRSVAGGFGLDDEAAVGSRHLELGSGRRPTPGYIHVDVDPGARHVELRADAGHLPLPDGWAREILAIHVLEHVPPRALASVLGEWRRVLAPGGVLRVHVPDSAAIMTRWLAADVDEKWALSGALLGMYANASVRRPEELQLPCDHQLLFDRDVMRSVLEGAGFSAVRDRTAEIDDVHTTGWKPLVDRISLVFEGVRP